jgi:hypothetical protein
MNWRVPVETESESKGEKTLNRQYRLLLYPISQSNVTVTVPQGVFWEVMSVNNNIAIGSVYGQRRVIFYVIRDGQNLFVSSTGQLNRNYTGYVSFAPGLDSSESVIGNSYFGSRSIPVIQFRGGDTINNIVYGAQAGDGITSRITIRESYVESY